jgi:hypothetical protein
MSTAAPELDIDAILEDQSDEIWACVKEDADAALAVNPDDEVAQSQLLKYEQFKRRQSGPKPKSGGLIIAKKPRVTSQERDRVGVWTQNATGDWIVFVRKAKVGDYVVLKKSNGKASRVRLLEEVGKNQWRV